MVGFSLGFDGIVGIPKRGGFGSLSALSAIPPMGKVWAAKSGLNAFRDLNAAAGLAASAITFGGSGTGVLASAEQYSGTIWITVIPMTVAAEGLSGCGTQTAVLGFGGDTAGPVIPTTQTYNGTSWGVGGNLNYARELFAGCGTQSACINFGGYLPGATGINETYNGSSWTTIAAILNTARFYHAGCGTFTSALCFGGQGLAQSLTEKYNGISWSNSGNMNVARYILAGAGVQSGGLGFGGFNGVSDLQTTEGFNGTSWVIGGNLNVPRGDLAGCGSSWADALSIGGYNGNSLSVVESYA